ncbi:hypothetical protein CPB85DRAFT_1258685 [Mucidula mucida]|nr:hypothetical protein CPB85DRAFT_1258685 [Mucidula mucida]
MGQLQHGANATNTSDTTPPTRSTKIGGKLHLPHNGVGGGCKGWGYYHDKYLEFKAKQKLGLFWPNVENTFLVRWPVSELCQQLGITEDDTVRSRTMSIRARWCIHYTVPWASELAWKDASPEIHEECTLEVEEEKKEKEQLKALDEEDEAGSGRQSNMLAHSLSCQRTSPVFASKIAERTGHMFLITWLVLTRGVVYLRSLNEAATHSKRHIPASNHISWINLKSMKGLFYACYAQNHIADNRRCKVLSVAPDAMLIDESTISAPVLTGLVETEDGLILLVRTQTLSTNSHVFECADGQYLGARWFHPADTLTPPRIECGIIYDFLYDSVLGIIDFVTFAHDSGPLTLLPLPMILSPTSMIPQGPSTLLPSSMIQSPASMIPQSEAYITPLPSLTPQATSINAPSNPPGSFTPPDFDWSLSTSDWNSLNEFMQGYDFTQDESLNLSSAPSKFTFSAFSQPSPLPAPWPSLFSLPAEPRPTPLMFSSPPRTTPQASSASQPSPTAQAGPLVISPEASKAKYTPLTTSAWNPHILRPTAIEDPLPPTSLIDKDIVLGGSLMGVTTPPPELPPLRRKNTKKGPAKKPPRQAPSKKAPVVAQTSAPAPPPSEPTPVPTPSELTQPRPKPRARVLSNTQPSIEEFPLISCGNNKENIPPWFIELALGMRGRAMGDEWDLLVRSFEHLEGDMSCEGIPQAEELMILRCGGEHGLVLVLLGLFWWGTLLGTSKQYDAQMKLWSAAVHNFQQCVEVMHDSGLATSGGSARKKARIS